MEAELVAPAVASRERGRQHHHPRLHSLTPPPAASRPQRPPCGDDFACWRWLPGWNPSSTTPRPCRRAGPISLKPLPLGAEVEYADKTALSDRGSSDCWAAIRLSSQSRVPWDWYQPQRGPLTVRSRPRLSPAAAPTISRTSSRRPTIIFGLYPTALIDWFKTYGYHQAWLYLYRRLRRQDRPCGAGGRPCVRRVWSSSSGHLMAGRETSSVEAAAEVSFAPANLSSLPTEKNTLRLSSGRKSWPRCWASATSALLTVQEHDKMIGYVSQLPVIAVSPMCANDNSSASTRATPSAIRPASPASTRRCGRSCSSGTRELHRRDRPVRFRLTSCGRLAADEWGQAGEIPVCPPSRRAVYLDKKDS